MNDISLHEKSTILYIKYLYLKCPSLLFPINLFLYFKSFELKIIAVISNMYDGHISCDVIHFW